MIEDPKQVRDSQMIAFSLVLLGLASVASGCYFHWEVLSSTATGVVGAGIMMLRGGGSAKPTANPIP